MHARWVTGLKFVQSSTSLLFAGAAGAVARGAALALTKSGRRPTEIWRVGSLPLASARGVSGTTAAFISSPKDVELRGLSDGRVDRIASPKPLAVERRWICEVIRFVSSGGN